MLQLDVKDKRGKEDDWWDWVYRSQLPWSWKGEHIPGRQCK
jgi:hypothetical protein